MLGGVWATLCGLLVYMMAAAGVVFTEAQHGVSARLLRNVHVLYAVGFSFAVNAVWLYVTVFLVLCLSCVYGVRFQRVMLAHLEDDGKLLFLLLPVYHTAGVLMNLPYWESKGQRVLMAMLGGGYMLWSLLGAFMMYRKQAVKSSSVGPFVSVYGWLALLGGAFLLGDISKGLIPILVEVALIFILISARNVTVAIDVDGVDAGRGIVAHTNRSQSSPKTSSKNPRPTDQKSLVS